MFFSEALKIIFTILEKSNLKSKFVNKHLQIYRAINIHMCLGNALRAHIRILRFQSSDFLLEISFPDGGQAK